MKRYIKNIFILVLFLLFFTPSVSSAADIFFTANKNSFAPNEDFLVQVFLDTKDISVNALEGAVAFSPEFLELREIRDGNSSINFWIERPQSIEGGKVVFSGITAGGFSGARMSLFGLVFRSKGAGNSVILFDNMQVLQNDGLGTKVSTKEVPFSFSISGESSGSPPEDIKVVDAVPPEDFIPFIGQDSTVFDGKYFLVFSAADKGIGIDHYEVREGIWGRYVTADSPYLLKDQSLRKNVYIKSIDKSGNERLVEINARNPGLRLEPGLIIGILILIIISIFLFKEIWLKFTRR